MNFSKFTLVVVVLFLAPFSTAQKSVNECRRLGHSVTLSALEVTPAAEVLKLNKALYACANLPALTDAERNSYTGLMGITAQEMLARFEAFVREKHLEAEFVSWDVGRATKVGNP